MFIGNTRPSAPPTASRTRRANRQPSPPPVAGPSTGVGSSSLSGGALFGNVGRDKPSYPQQRSGADQQREREREHREQHQHTGTGGTMELSEEQKAEINEAVSLSIRISNTD